MDYPAVDLTFLWHSDARSNSAHVLFFIGKKWRLWLRGSYRWDGTSFVAKSLIIILLRRRIEIFDIRFRKRHAHIGWVENFINRLINLRLSFSDHVVEAGFSIIILAGGIICRHGPCRSFLGSAGSAFTFALLGAWISFVLVSKLRLILNRDIGILMIYRVWVIDFLLNWGPRLHSGSRSHRLKSRPWK